MVYRQTDRQTNRQTTITPRAAHGRRGLIIIIEHCVNTSLDSISYISMYIIHIIILIRSIRYRHGYVCTYMAGLHSAASLAR